MRLRHHPRRWVSLDAYFDRTLVLYVGALVIAVHWYSYPRTFDCGSFGHQGWRFRWLWFRLYVGMEGKSHLDPEPATWGGDP